MKSKKAKKEIFHIRVMRMTEKCDLQIKATDMDNASDMVLDMASKGDLNDHFEPMTENDITFMSYVVVQIDSNFEELLGQKKTMLQ